MIMPKGKKGQLLLYGLMAAIIAGVTIAYINTAKAYEEFSIIGQSSLELIDLSIEANKALLYIDQSAKYSAYQTIYDLAEKGGCSNGNKYLDYTLWDDECDSDSESTKNNFPDIFSDNLNNYLSKYEAVELPLNNYNLDFKNNNLIGTAENSLVVQEEIPSKLGQPDEDGIYKYGARGATPIWYRNLDGGWEWTPYDPYDPGIDCWMPVKKMEVSNDCGGKWDGKEPAKANRDIINYLSEMSAYSIEPSFKLKIDYDFSDYDELRKNAEDLMDLCKDSDNIESCIITNKFDVFNTNNLELMETCGTEEKEKLLEFADYLQSCVDSVDDTCVCLNKPDGTFNIKESDTGIEINGKTIELENVNLLQELNIKSGQFLYKDGDKKITVVRGYDEDEDDICDIKEKTKFRFCIKSNENQFYVYDDDKVELRNVVYKFALEFNE